MLSIKQHLLIKLGEEAGEIQQAVSKMLIFGDDDRYTVDDLTNVEKLEKEINDLAEVVNMLSTVGVPLYLKTEYMGAKHEKVRKWMKYSQAKGLTESPSLQQP